MSLTMRITREKAVDIDNNQQKIKIHYVKWSKNYDEWLEMSSDRIVSEDDDNVSEESFSEACNSENIEMKEVIGKLLNVGDQSYKTVISAYEIGKNVNANEKNLNRFSVPIIKGCAEILRIKCENNSGKKFNKADLIRKIVSRIDSMMPGKCSQCSESYRMELNEIPLFTCHICSRGSHSCDSVREFRASLPKDLILGMVWLCDGCVDSTDAKCDLIMNDEEPSDLNADNDTIGNDNLTEAMSVSESSKAQVKITNGLQFGASHPVLTSRRENNDIPKSNDNLRNICPKYRRGVCPHGIRGNKLIEGVKCVFNHPKPCQKYCQFGSKGPGGCKDRRTCNLFHPVLCRYSLKNRLCVKEDCVFVHLKGTARKVSDTVSPSNKVGKSNHIEAGVKSVDDKMADNNLQKSDFLVLKQMIEELQNRFMRELSQISQINRYPQSYPTQPMYNPYQYHPQQYLMNGVDSQSIPTPIQNQVQPRATMTYAGALGKPVLNSMPPSCY